MCDKQLYTQGLRLKLINYSDNVKNIFKHELAFGDGYGIDSDRIVNRIDPKHSQEM